MKRIFIFSLTCFVAIMLGYIVVAEAEISGTRYRITTFAISSGGGTTISENFNAHFLLGQSSPLQDSDNPSYSDSYELYPGFCYTFDHFKALKKTLIIPNLPLLLLNN